MQSLIFAIQNKIGCVAQLNTCLPAGREHLKEMGMKVYVLQSQKDGRLYVGMSENVELRLKQHNKGMTTSTNPYKPWILLFTEEYPNRLEARKREKFLKAGSGKEYIKKWLRSSTE